MMIIRKLGVEDAGVVRAIETLRNELSETEALIDRAAFGATLGNADAALFVAIDDAKTEDGRVVGAGMAMLFWKPTGWQAEIHDVVVRESHRGQGIGRKIVEALIGWTKERAKQKNIKIAIRLTSRPKRIVANELYKKIGFTLLAGATENGTNLYELKINP